MRDIQKEFEDAVSLVQKLPKDGPYKPSDEVRLRFYALYKQAVFGPNTTPQPSFLWDPVGRYKWKAWSDLGTLSRTESMQEYVEELRKLVNSIPDTEDSAAFLTIFRDKFEMEPGYKILERSHECVEVTEGREDTEEYLDTTPTLEDTLLNPEPSLRDTRPTALDNSNTEHSSDSTQATCRKKKRKPGKKNSESFGSSEACSSDVRIIDVESQILRTLRLMRQDVRGLLKRMDTLETMLVQRMLTEDSNNTTLSNLWSSRWFIFMVTWPVLTQILGLWYVRRYYKKR